MGKKLLIAGGGTGGHIFPGIAIAEEWRSRGGDVVFIGTPSGQEGRLVPKYGFDLRFLKVGSLKGGGLGKKLKTVAGLPMALFASCALLRRERPDAVLGIGGYASGPLCLAAALCGKNTAITDQNVQPGLTNRILGKFVRRVFLSFEKSSAFFARRKIAVTGNPVRSQIRHAPYVLPRDDLRIFVFGGSQGAVPLNECFLKALDLARELWPKLKVTHQAGRTDLESVETFYHERGIRAVVSAFFDDMDALYRDSHVVICRSGAGTMTELALSGRPAFFVPYPYAADDHQAKNAQVFVDAGAAWMTPQKDLTPEILAEKIRGFFAHPEELAAKAEAMRKLARPDAAKDIVDQLMG